MNGEKCPYHKGLQKDGRKTFIRCDNALLQYADDNEPVRPPDRPFFTTDKCLSENNESPYTCRAFLVTSIKSKNVNVGSDHSIPELQQIYERVKNRTGCGDCEFYWWSAGYENAAEPSKLTGFDGWKEWQSRKIPCEIFTHYCRPEYSTLHKITDDEIWFCTRPTQPTQEVSQVKKTAMTESTVATGTLTDHRNIEIITEEIRFYMLQHVESGYEIGKRLNEAKEQLERGEWLEWLRDRVEFSDATAQRYMRLAREYTNPSLVTDLGTSKALALLALPPSERDAFLEETHEVDGEEKNVLDMSKREIEKAVRERAEALQQKAEAEAAAENARKVAEENAAKLKEADERAAAAEAERVRIENELRELQNAEPGPLPEEPDQQTFEAIRKEAAAEAKKEAEAKLKKKVDAAAEDKKKAEAERDLVKQNAEREQAAAAERITALEKKLAAASSESVTIFKTHFENAQGCVNSMLGCLMKLKDAPETQVKLTNALRALCEKTLQGLPRATTDEGAEEQQND